MFGHHLSHPVAVQVLLQESLRPILVQLGYHNKLQLPLLKGLARLLQLLSSWFNITLVRCSLSHDESFMLLQSPAPLVCLAQAMAADRCGSPSDWCD